MRKFVLVPVLLLISCLLGLSGCSVIMAATPSNEPELEGLQTGVARADVEKELGKPIEVQRKWDVDIATYQYVSNDEASFGRAGFYAVVDVLTLGISELVFTPIESLQGDREYIRVVYDLNNRLVSAKRFVRKALLDAPEDMLGITGAKADGQQQAVTTEEAKTADEI